jgi:hypothetical protein
MRKKGIWVVLLSMLLNVSTVTGFAVTELVDSSSSTKESTVISNEVSETTTTTSITDILESIGTDESATQSTTEEPQIWVGENTPDSQSDVQQVDELNENEITRIKNLYERAISEGKVNRNMYSFNSFQTNYVFGKETYNQTKDIVGQGLDYDSWFGQILNYNAFPDGEGHPVTGKNQMLRGTQQQNADKFKRDIRKGDIIIVQSGGFGHAAIATSDNYILEMSGGGNFGNWFLSGIPNNNHQFNKDNWLWGRKEQGATPAKMINSYLQVWRIPNKSMANQCATYADKMFWNSSGGYKRNRYIEYKLASRTLSTNPNYCSKMVFQAYWNGSGSAPVMKDFASGLTFISPGALPNLFTDKYAPYKVDTY